MFQAELVFLELYIIDLGDCVSAAKPGYSMIGTEFCRPPEVTLGTIVSLYRFTI